MKLRYLSLLFVISLIHIACEPEILVLPEDTFGYEYYPLELGKYWIYQVDSLIVLNENDPHFKSESFVKEQITNLFENEQGDTCYVLSRFVGPAQEGPYKLTDTWKIERTNSSLLRIEENLKFVKLVFPINVGQPWDGNLFDQQTDIFVAQNQVAVYLEWEYEVLNNSASISINDSLYNNVVRIQQANYDSGLELRNANEWYAPGIGLIKRSMTILNTQDFPSSDPWLDRATSGFILEQVLVESN